jgi:hypothetical protein
MRYRQTFARSAVTGAMLLLAGSFPAHAAGEWGTLKGQVVWAGPAGFKAPELKVDKDREHCLSKGALLDDKYVVNPKNKGVRWVMVWLVDASGPGKKLPIHPSLKNVKGTKVVLDQPCCQFQPHAFGIREGQILVAKNSSPIAHNVNIVSLGDENPSLNQIIPPGQNLEVENWRASSSAILLSCSIHPWMKSSARVFNHPYFAVTDADGNFELKKAPAGKFNLVSWTNDTGWVKGGKKGVPVEIEAGATTDFGKIDLKPGD